MPSSDTTNDDESVRIDIAVRALGDMRSRASGEGRAFSSSSDRGEEQDEIQQQSVSSNRDFMSRMSSFPLVGTALRAYEHGKASSSVVKYGARMVESSVKTISKPVINRLPVNQIDEFACRQLDKFDKYRRPSVGPESPTRSTTRRMSDVDDAGSSSISADHEPDRGRPKLRTKTFDGSPAPGDDFGYPREHHEDSLERRKYVGSVPQWIESTHSYARTPGSGAASPMEDSSPITFDDRRTRSPDHQTSHREIQSSDQQSQNPERQVAQRSRWQAMLLEAGGLGVALSDENMRRLKYCLNWLLYATAHIDAQILVLRDLIESIQPMPQPNSSSHRRPPISEDQLRKLTQVRKDIVSTVRQMVDVVSKYAGGALPEPARGRVRGFILKLPHRWASRTAAAGVGAGTPTSASTPTAGGGGEKERERETVAAAGSSTGVLRRGQGRDKRAAQRERGTGSRAPSPTPANEAHSGQSSSVQSQQQQMSHSSASAAAQRILSLATESLDMMRNVTGVVKDSLDRADAWVNRLRMVGVQRGGQDSRDDDETQSLNEEFGPPRIGSAYDRGASITSSREDYRTLFQTHRRNASSTSSSFLGGEEGGTSAPASPFTTTTSLTLGSFVSGASTDGVPSTPTGTMSFTLPPVTVRGGDVYGVTSVPSPGPISSFESMRIESRFGTPKMGVGKGGFPVEGDGEDGVGEKGKEAERRMKMEVDDDEV
ncbi:hypothetical protein D9756_002796 [Leucocoprinus leucothites]|uniref:Opi1-domain-containing protein n=1 Tax=Leucocoprinus leucothites TaxID=201217 RepID=A0A8H5GCG0_9AGAR|nr:hypothetical protein D9756_002796 [Leucoagaricus leucothites]